MKAFLSLCLSACCLRLCQENLGKGAVNCCCQVGKGGMQHDISFDGDAQAKKTLKRKTKLFRTLSGDKKRKMCGRRRDNNGKQHRKKSGKRECVSV